MSSGLFPMYRIECQECNTSFTILENPGTGTCYFGRCPNQYCDFPESAELKETKIESVDDL